MAEQEKKKQLAQRFEVREIPVQTEKVIYDLSSDEENPRFYNLQESLAKIMSDIDHLKKSLE